MFSRRNSIFEDPAIKKKQILFRVNFNLRTLFQTQMPPSKMKGAFNRFIYFLTHMDGSIKSYRYTPIHHCSHQ